MTSLRYELPAGLTCTHCLLVFRYVTGRTWGRAANGTGCLGCGHQEEFRACADVAIKPSVTPDYLQPIKLSRAQKRTDQFVITRPEGISKKKDIKFFVNSESSTKEAALIEEGEVISKRPVFFHSDRYETTVRLDTEPSEDDATIESSTESVNNLAVTIAKPLNDEQVISFSETGYTSDAPSSPSTSNEGFSTTTTTASSTVTTVATISSTTAEITTIISSTTVDNVRDIIIAKITGNNIETTQKSEDKMLQEVTFNSVLYDELNKQDFNYQTEDENDGMAYDSIAADLMLADIQPATEPKEEDTEYNKYVYSTPVGLGMFLSIPVTFMFFFLGFLLYLKRSSQVTVVSNKEDFYVYPHIVHRHGGSAPALYQSVPSKEHQKGIATADYNQPFDKDAAESMDNLADYAVVPDIVSTSLVPPHHIASSSTDISSLEAQQNAAMDITVQRTESTGDGMEERGGARMFTRNVGRRKSGIAPRRWGSEDWDQDESFFSLLASRIQRKQSRPEITEL